MDIVNYFTSRDGALIEIRESAIDEISFVDGDERAKAVVKLKDGGRVYVRETTAEISDRWTGIAEPKSVRAAEMPETDPRFLERQYHALRLKPITKRDSSPLIEFFYSSQSGQGFRCWIEWRDLVAAHINNLVEDELRTGRSGADHRKLG